LVGVLLLRMDGDTDGACVGKALLVTVGIVMGDGVVGWVARVGHSI